MEGSPYNSMLDIMKEEGYNKDVSVRVGEISSLSPFKVKLNGYEVDEEDMYISETLSNILKDDLGEVTVVHLSGPGDALSDETSTLKTKNKVKIGDKVLLLIEDETFYLIDRVV